MNKLPRFKVYSINLGLGLNSELTGLFGDYIVCLKASERFLISLNDDLQIPLEQGLSFRVPDGFEKINKVQLATTAAAAISPNVIELGIGEGELRDLRFNSSAPLTIAPGTIIQSEVPSELASDAADIALVADTNTLIGGADATQRTIIVANDSATVTVRLGTNTAHVSGTRGLPLLPKEKVELDLRGALYARAIGGAATVSVTKLKF